MGSTPGQKPSLFNSRGNPSLWPLVLEDQTLILCSTAPSYCEDREKRGTGFYLLAAWAMPPDKLEESFHWLCESWKASWACAVCTVFILYTLSSESPSYLFLPQCSTPLSLSSQKSLTGTFLSYLPLSLCCPPPPSHSLPPSVSLILSPAALRWLALLKVCRLA